MITLKKKIKIALGLVAVGTLFVGTFFGVLNKESNPKVGQKQIVIQEKQNGYLDNQSTQEKKLICRQLLEEDENDLVFNEYTEATPVECMTVGCGGFL